MTSSCGRQRCACCVYAHCACCVYAYCACCMCAYCACCMHMMTWLSTQSLVPHLRHPTWHAGTQHGMLCVLCRGVRCTFKYPCHIPVCTHTHTHTHKYTCSHSACLQKEEDAVLAAIAAAHKYVKEMHIKFKKHRPSECLLVHYLIETLVYVYITPRRPKLFSNKKAFFYKLF